MNAGVTIAATASDSRESRLGVFVRERAWSPAVWSAMAGWIAVLFVVTRNAYLGFRTGRFDLGNMVQAVWSTAHRKPGGVARKPSWEGREAAPCALDARRAALEVVPPDAPVSATNRLGSYLSARRYVYSVPVLGRADWIVVDTSDPWMAGSFGGGADVPRFEACLARLRSSVQWRKGFEQRPVLVYRRVGA